MKVIASRSFVNKTSNTFVPISFSPMDESCLHENKTYEENTATNEIDRSRSKPTPPEYRSEYNGSHPQNIKPMETNYRPRARSIVPESRNQYNRSSSRRYDSGGRSRSPQSHRIISRSPQSHRIISRSPQSHRIISRSPSSHRIRSRSPQSQRIRSRSPQSQRIRSRSPSSYRTRSRSPNRYDRSQSRARNARATSCHPSSTTSRHKSPQSNLVAKVSPYRRESDRSDHRGRSRSVIASHHLTEVNKKVPMYIVVGGKPAKPILGILFKSEYTLFKISKSHTDEGYAKCVDTWTITLSGKKVNYGKYYEEESYIVNQYVASKMFLYEFIKEITCEKGRRETILINISWETRKFLFSYFEGFEKDIYQRLKAEKRFQQRSVLQARRSAPSNRRSLMCMYRKCEDISSCPLCQLDAIERLDARFGLKFKTMSIQMTEATPGDHRDSRVVCLIETIVNKPRKQQVLTVAEQELSLNETSTDDNKQIECEEKEIDKNDHDNGVSRSRSRSLSRSSSRSSSSESSSSSSGSSSSEEEDNS